MLEAKERKGIKKWKKGRRVERRGAIRGMGDVHETVSTLVCQTLTHQTDKGTWTGTVLKNGNVHTHTHLYQYTHTHGLSNTLTFVKDMN